MKSLLMAAMLVLALVANVEARGVRRYYQQPYDPQQQQQVFASVPATPVQTVSQTTAPTTTTTEKPNVGIGGVPQPGTSTQWSAQWKAEQSARNGSVAHIGGPFGGGSYEGNGFGATPEQAVTNSCFWGQRTPIEIGVARGANGYYATIFYR